MAPYIHRKAWFLFSILAAAATLGAAHAAPKVAPKVSKDDCMKLKRKPAQENGGATSLTPEDEAILREACEILKRSDQGPAPSKHMQDKMDSTWGTEEEYQQQLRRQRKRKP